MFAKSALAPTDKRFRADAYLRRLEAHVTQNPDGAPRAYLLAADRMRAEAKKPENARDAAALQVFASQLDSLARDNAATVLGLAPALEAAREAKALGLPSPLASDFDQITHRMAKAIGESSGDELAKWAAFEQVNERQQRRESIPVRIIPTSARHGQTMFGNLVTVQNQPTTSIIPNTTYLGFAGQSTTETPPAEAQVIRWDGRDYEALPVTITVGRVENSGGALFPLASSLTYRPYFKMQWGVRGYTQDTVTGDVGRGVKFSVAASFVYLSVGMDPPDTTTGGLAGRMQLGACIGFFASHTESPITRTVYVDSLASGAGGAKIITIPPFATMLLPLQFSDLSAGNQLKLDFLTPSAALTPMYSLQFSNGGSTFPIPLSNDAYQIRVTNNNAGTTPNVRLVFQLAL